MSVTFRATPIAKVNSVSLVILVDSLGQFAGIQLLLSLALPRQVLPPLAGSGLSQILVRNLVPVLHVTLQSDQLDHMDQAPFTADKLRTISRKISIGRVGNILWYR